MGRHLTVPLVTIPLTFPLSTVRTAQPRKLPQKPPSRTGEAQRRYRHRNALASGPNVTPDVLERKRSIAKTRRKFALVAVRCRALPQQTCDLTKPCDAATNWTFTVSDKQNTVPAFPSTMATTSCLSPLPTTPCRSTFPENAPLPILAFLHPAFVPIAAGSAAPMQAWLSWPHAQPVIDKDDVLAAAPPLYLPMHQQDIIYTILYCVLRHRRQRARMYTVFGGLSQYVASQHALR
jgi:hypothetical protein